jgi:predicted GH43/DUF377 family glycosyl hydrolase
MNDTKITKFTKLTKFQTLTRLDEPTLEPDYGRLVIRPFVPLKERILHIIARIAALSDETIREELQQVTDEFSNDHADLPARFKEHFAIAEAHLKPEDQDRRHNARSDGLPAQSAQSIFPIGKPMAREPVTRERPEGAHMLSPEGRLLAGAYFTSEYAFEATALFNPSIVAAPSERRVLENPTEIGSEGSLRFIMSTRSVGEGHVSSISFRTGTIDQAGGVFLDPAERTAVTGIRSERDGVQEVQFDPETKLSGRLLFPQSRSDRNGMEDARFVRFADDDGSIRYYATYTAYDGRRILPQMLETEDFLKFRILPLGGAMVRNKGMALFPRKIKGPVGKGPADKGPADPCYAMLSRVDGESIYLMYSEDLQTWNEGIKIVSPRFPWEFMQLGNCGSPIELDEGWLVLTHGVGSLRRYSIGALLLDKDDPSRIIGRLAEPLISPEERERTGYVPNVVYTCGSIIHRNRLVIPYGSADRSIAFITVGLDELMERLRN